MAFQLDHVVLWVADVPRALAFYVDVVGLPGVRRFSGERKPTGAGLPINHLCLAMDAEELDALATRLASAGVSTHRVGERNFGARGWSTEWFYFQDPDGNMIEARHYE